MASLDAAGHLARVSTICVFHWTCIKAKERLATSSPQNISTMLDSQRRPFHCDYHSKRERQAMATGTVTSPRSTCHKGGGQHRQLQRWDQRMPESQAMAAGAVVAQRDVGGEVGARHHLSYNASISACGTGRQWQRALRLLSEMWEAKLVANLQRWDQRVREGRPVAACPRAAARDAGGDAGARGHTIYNAGISACEKGRQWQQALSLLSRMWGAKVEPDPWSATTL
ncbi:unnamed protein product [Prorocentrum cordatum]|uniref:Pentatricopeptide repeat-containing protein n=1 Tax=Prorocentrum cordatum TaxID=2364126 RepID=A0ABN9TNK5_9DINO|nr:unnamed protein product [Polarella glacialis]